MRDKALVLLAVAALLFGTSGTGYALLEQKELTDLTIAADEIIIGTVDDQYVAFVDENIIHTFSEVFVEYSFLGAAPSSRSIVVETAGGEIGDLGLWVEDQPVINVGERVVLFLNGNEERGTFTINNHVQGKYTMDEDWVVEYDVHISDFVGMMFGYLTEDNGGPGVESLACTIGDLGIAWNGDRAGMWWNKNGTNDCSGEAPATRKGGLEWNNVSSCPFYFYVAGSNYGTGPNYDGKNQVWFGSGSGYIAATWIWYSGSRYMECDFMFNDNYAWSSSQSCPGNKMDVQNIACHELGHCWGAGDEYNSGCSNATMYGYANYGETKKRSVESWDIDAIRRVY